MCEDVKVAPGSQRLSCCVTETSMWNGVLNTTQLAPVKEAHPGLYRWTGVSRFLKPSTRYCHSVTAAVFSVATVASCTHLSARVQGLCQWMLGTYMYAVGSVMRRHAHGCGLNGMFD